MVLKLVFIFFEAVRARIAVSVAWNSVERNPGSWKSQYAFFNAEFFHFFRAAHNCLDSQSMELRFSGETVQRGITSSAVRFRKHDKAVFREYVFLVLRDNHLAHVWSEEFSPDERFECIFRELPGHWLCQVLFWDKNVHLRQRVKLLVGERLLVLWILLVDEVKLSLWVLRFEFTEYFECLLVVLLGVIEQRAETFSLFLYLCKWQCFPV